MNLPKKAAHGGFAGNLGPSNSNEGQHSLDNYKRIVDDQDGEFIVTMEHPRTSSPRPLVVEVDHMKARVKRSQSVGAVALPPVSTSKLDLPDFPRRP